MIQRDNLRHYGSCWLFGHAWQFSTPEWASKLDCIPVTLTCARCSTERREGWSPTGAIVTRHYVYPDGYSLAERITGVRRPTRQEIREMVANDRKMRVMKARQR